MAGTSKLKLNMYFFKQSSLVCNVCNSKWLSHLSTHQKPQEDCVKHWLLSPSPDTLIHEVLGGMCSYLGTNFENCRIGRCIMVGGCPLSLDSSNVPSGCSLPLAVHSLVLIHGWGCPLQDITPASDLVELISLGGEKYYVIILFYVSAASIKIIRKVVTNEVHI